VSIFALPEELLLTSLFGSMPPTIQVVILQDEDCSPSSEPLVEIAHIAADYLSKAKANEHIRKRGPN
jgi:hypothetical protein